MNNYSNRMLELLEEEFLDGILERHFLDDIITNKAFRVNSSLLTGKFDPMYFTGMNVIIAHLVRKFSSISEAGITVLSGDPFKSKFFGIGDFKLIRIRDIKRNYIAYDNATLIPGSQFDAFPRSSAQFNDILVGMDGDEFRAARVTREMLPCAINQRIAIIRGLPEDEAIFYMLAINSYVGVYQLERVKTYAGTVGHISLQDIKDLRFPKDQTLLKFVSGYKEAIKDTADLVSDIKSRSDRLRIDMHAQLDLKPEPALAAFVQQK